MLYEGKYDIDAFKKHYDKANKNFNPQSLGGSDKEPSPRLFKTKIWYKMYALSYKTYEKAKEANSTYYGQIEDTKGDYSRRGHGVGEQVKAMYDFMKSEVAKFPDLKFTMIGVFLDTCENLFDLKWRVAYKLAFEYASKDGKTKSLVSAYKVMYFCQAYAVESMMLRFLDYTFKVDAGVPPVEAIQYQQKHNPTFMDKIIFPTINLNAMLKGTNDPVKMLKSYISGEKNSEKSTESMLSPITSEEGAFFQGLKKASGNILMIAVTGAGAAFAAMSLGTGVLGIAGIVVASVITLFNTISLIRVMVYYCAAAKVDMVKELELNREMLENNILVLKEKLKSLPDGKEKDKLQKVIDRQIKYKDHIDKKINGKNVDDNAIENSLEADESSADKEADSHAKDTNTDGDYTDNNSDDFSIEI